MSATKTRTLAALPLTTRGSPVHLGGDPKGKNFLYTNGRSVIIRDIENPAIADVYTEHLANVTVAKYAPSGYYIASGDATGAVRIWDTTQLEHPLKLEVKALSGDVRDLAWDSESKRIIAVGNGQESFGRAFIYDAGTSVGEISGHSKTINSVDIKPVRPYRAITVSDDLGINTFEGPPFKYKSSHKEHTRFINCVRYNSTGTHYVTVSSDTKGLLFDAKTGDRVGELAGHSGAIFSCSWSPDGTKLMTSSADKTVRVWDIATQATTTTFTFGTTVDDQQLGCLWQGKHQLSVSLSGEINYLDAANPSKPSRVIRGHAKPISSGVVSTTDKTFYAGDAAGRVVAWSLDSGEGTPFQGTGHSNQTSAIALQGSAVVSAGMDDTVRYTPIDTKVTGADAVKTGSQPRSLASHSSGVSVLVAIDGVHVLVDGKVASTISTQAYSVAISPDATEVAVGVTDAIQFYALSAGTLTATTRLAEGVRGQVVALAYSPNGAYLASGDTIRQVVLIQASDKKVLVSDWVFHQARVTALDWAPSSKRLASAAIDTNIYIWSVDQPNSRILIKNAHLGPVNAVGWVDENTLVSAGQDAFIKTWAITY